MAAPDGFDDEHWHRAQQHAYCCWIRHHLRDSGIPFGAITDLSDGVSICALLVALTGKPMRYNKSPKTYSHKLDNVTLATQFMATEGLQLNIAPEDIVSAKNPRLYDTICWALLRKYQLQDEAGDELLAWCNAQLRAYKIHVVDFTVGSWEDGVAVTLLVGQLVAGELDAQGAPARTGEQNWTQALNVAEKRLGVPRLLSVDDILTGYVDEHALRSWLSFLPKAEQRQADKSQLERQQRAAIAARQMEIDSESISLNQRLRLLKRMMMAILDHNLGAPAAKDVPATADYSILQMDRLEEEIKKLAAHVDRVERAREQAEFEQSMASDQISLLTQQLRFQEKKEAELAKAKDKAVAESMRQREQAAKSSATSAGKQDASAATAAGPLEQEVVRLKSELVWHQQKVGELGRELSRVYDKNIGGANAGKKELLAQIGQLERDKQDLQTQMISLVRAGEFRGGNADPAGSQANVVSRTSESALVGRLRDELERTRAELRAAKEQEKQTNRELRSQEARKTTEEVLRLRTQLDELKRQQDAERNAQVDALRGAVGGPVSDGVLRLVKEMQARLSETTDELAKAKTALAAEKKADMVVKLEWQADQLEHESRERAAAEARLTVIDSEWQAKLQQRENELVAEINTVSQRAMSLEEQRLKLKASVARLHAALDDIANTPKDEQHTKFAAAIRNAEVLAGQNDKLHEQLLDYAHEMRRMKQLQLVPGGPTIPRFHNEEQLLKQLARLEKYRAVYKRALRYRQQLEAQLDAEKTELHRMVGEGKTRIRMSRAAEDHKKFDKDFTDFTLAQNGIASGSYLPAAPGASAPTPAPAAPPVAYPFAPAALAPGAAALPFAEPAAPAPAHAGKPKPFHAPGPGRKGFVIEFKR